MFRPFFAFSVIFVSSLIASGLPSIFYGLFVTLSSISSTMLLKSGMAFLATIGETSFLMRLVIDWLFLSLWTLLGGLKTDFFLLALIVPLVFFPADALNCFELLCCGEKIVEASILPPLYVFQPLYGTKLILVYCTFKWFIPKLPPNFLERETDFFWVDILVF